eukprot:2211225-Amphidinium_carterae.1
MLTEDFDKFSGNSCCTLCVELKYFPHHSTNITTCNCCGRYGDGCGEKGREWISFGAWRISCKLAYLDWQ